MAGSVCCMREVGMGSKEYMKNIVFKERRNGINSFK